MPHPIRRPSWGIAAITVAIAAAVAARAEARPTRVAIAPIDGDDAGIAAAVADALDDSELEVVAGKPVSRAIGRLGLDAALAERDAARLAADLAVDAVVCGELDAGGHRLRFTIVSHGAASKPVNVAVGKVGSDRFRKVVRNALIARTLAAAAAHPRSGDQVADIAEAVAKPAGKRVAGKIDDSAESETRPAGKRVASKGSDAAESEAKPGRKHAAGKDDDSAESDVNPAGKHPAGKSDDSMASEAKLAGKHPAGKIDDSMESEARPAGKRVASKGSDAAELDAKSVSKRAAGKSDESAESEAKSAGKRATGKSGDSVESDAKPAGKRVAGKIDDSWESEARPAGKRVASKGSDAAESEAKSVSKRAAGKSDDSAESEAKSAGKRAAGKVDDSAESEAKPGRKHAAGKGDESAESDAKPAGKHAAGKVGDAAESDARPAGKRVAGRSEDSAEPEAESPRRAASDDDGDAVSDRSPIGVRDRGEPAARVAHSANLAAVRIELGGSMAGRSLAFDTRGFSGAPAAYRNAPVPGARAAGEVYPYAFIDPGSWLAGFGLAADYDRTLSLTLRASQEMTVPLAIAENHYAVGVRYRLALGHQPTSATLTVGAGYAARRFTVDRSGLMAADSIDLPDVDYRMFDPGLAFRLPLGRRVAVSLAARALLVMSTGAVQRPDQYGAARVLGGAAAAAIEIAIIERVALRLAAEGTQIEMQFVGNGTLATSRDGDSSTVDVRGMTDRYYGGVATLAVAY